MIWYFGRSSQYVRISFQAARFRLQVSSRERRLRFRCLGGSGEAGAGLWGVWAVHKTVCGPALVVLRYEGSKSGTDVPGGLSAGV